MKQLDDQEYMHNFGQNWLFLAKIRKDGPPDPNFQISVFLNPLRLFWYPPGMNFIKKLDDQEYRQTISQNWPFLVKISKNGPPGPKFSQCCIFNPL